jgi:hypothetical protein
MSGEKTVMLASHRSAFLAIAILMAPIGVSAQVQSTVVSQPTSSGEQGVVVVERRAGSPPPRIVEVERPAQDYLRARFHAGMAGGFFLGGLNMNGGMGGLIAAIGIQFNSLFAIYAQSIGQLGVFFNAANFQGAFAAFSYNMVMLELTFAHFFQVAVGPSLDFLGIAACDAMAGCSSGTAGPYFGADARVALAIGGHDVGTRGAFFIAGDFHPTIFDWGTGINGLFAIIFSVGGMVY